MTPELASFAARSEWRRALFRQRYAHAHAFPGSAWINFDRGPGGPMAIGYVPYAKTEESTMSACR